MTKAIQTLIDEARELEIQWCGKSMEVALALGEREQAEAWRLTMERAIAERSPSQRARMEQALDEGVGYFAWAGRRDRAVAQVRSR